MVQERDIGGGIAAWLLTRGFRKEAVFIEDSLRAGNIVTYGANEPGSFKFRQYWPVTLLDQAACPARTGRPAD